MKNRKWALTALAVITAVFMTYTAYSFTAGDEPEPRDSEMAMRGDQGGGMDMGRDQRMQPARGGNKGQSGGMGMGAGMSSKKSMLVMKIFQRVLEDMDFQEAVGLTDAQVDKIETLLDQSQRSMVRSQADMQILQMDLEDLMDATTPDIKKIDAKIDEIGKVQTQSFKDMAHLQVELRQIVTEEQISKAKQYFKQMKNEMRGQMQGRKNQGGQRMDGDFQGGPRDFNGPADFEGDYGDDMQ